MNQITIKDLEVFGHHGVYKEEILLGQKFLVSAVMDMDFNNAIISDDLLQSIDYADVCKFIENYMKRRTCKLLETLATNMADEILLKYPRVKSIEIEIKKPWAPVNVSMQYVSVRIKRGWHKSYIAVCSNMGDKKKNIDDAIAIIESEIKCRVLKVSDFIVASPISNIEQDDYLCGCIELDTIYPPNELLVYLQAIENQAKRDRKIYGGPRTLDLDILFYDDIIMYDAELVIPHPEINKRMFVLEPLCQIAPYYVHPLLHERIVTIKSRVQNN